MTRNARDLSNWCILKIAHRDVRLRLLASKKFPDGVVRLHYAVLA
jgi:hypothetical protein